MVSLENHIPLLLLTVTVVSVSIGLTTSSTVSQARSTVSSGSVQNWTEEDFKTVLAPLEERNRLRGAVGKGQVLCSRREWETTLGPFISAPGNPYPLEGIEDWQALTSALIKRKVASTTGIRHVMTSASAEICFTGGPFTICTERDVCACDENNYIQKNGTCYGKLHANCGLGVECISGLPCVFRNCWANSEIGCTGTGSDVSKVLGYCGGKDDIYFEYRRRKWPYKQFEYLMQGVIVSAVSLFGLLGNLLSVLVLTRPQLRSSMSYVLLGMTISDIVYLVGQFLDTGIDNSISYFTVTRERFVYMGDDDGGSYSYSLMRKWSYFLYEIGNVGSIYFTVLVSLERYIVICHSLKAKRFCTRRKALCASISVCLFTLMFNLPKLFATEIGSDFPRPTTSGGRQRFSPLDRSLPNMTIRIPEEENGRSRPHHYFLMTTPFGYTMGYNLYMRWGKIIFKYFVPFYWLIFFNFWIILELKRSDIRRRRMTNGGCQQYQCQDGRLRQRGSRSSTTTSTTRMMLCVVGVFGISYLPLFIHEFFFRIPNYQPFGHNFDLMYRSIISSVIYSFVKLFATFNSSVNFVIYCVLGEKFRMSLKLMLCSWRRQEDRHSRREGWRNGSKG